jgi:hypothetical protein
MHKHHISAKTLIGLGAWILALGAVAFVSGYLAIALVVIGVVLVFLGVSGREDVQRQIPALGRLPLVEDHQFIVRGLRDDVPPPKSIAIEDRAKQERREVLQLARMLLTELRTCRDRIQRALNTNSGWTSDRALPSQRFHEWSNSPVTASETHTNEALTEFYVWADAMNHDFRGRQSRDVNEMGEVTSNRGLALGGGDQHNLEVGSDLAQRAEAEVQALLPRQDQ